MCKHCEEGYPVYQDPDRSVCFHLVDGIYTICKDRLPAIRIYTI